MRQFLLVYILIFTSTIHLSSAEGNQYIYNLPPGNSPTEVEIFFFLNDINYINEQDETFDINGTLELTWFDQRQAFDTLEAGANYKLYQGSFQFLEIYQGWWPQLVASNSLGTIPLQDVSLRINYDGTMVMIQEVAATLKSSMDLHKYPFDQQKLEIILQPLSFVESELKLISDEDMMDMPRHHLNIASWDLLHIGVEERIELDKKANRAYSQVVISLDTKRKPGYTTWLVFIPLTFIIFLSTSIYWMDAESLGNRMDISFIGLLTIVAYQAMVESGLPKIDYFTLINGFVYISYLIMATFIISNILIDQLNRKNKVVLADKIDIHARWILPVAYVTLNLISGFYFYFG